MSPVDRAGSVSEISPRHSFLYKNLDVFIQEGGLAFWTFLNSVTGIKFPIWTEDKIRHACMASLVTGLIWRGPKLAPPTPTPHNN